MTARHETAPPLGVGVHAATDLVGGTGVSREGNVSETRPERDHDSQPQNQANERSAGFRQTGGEEKRCGGSRRVVRAGNLEDGDGDAGRNGSCGRLRPRRCPVVRSR
jgi:hypothetical protein